MMGDKPTLTFSDEAHYLRFIALRPGEWKNWAEDQKEVPAAAIFGRFDALQILSTRDPLRFKVPHVSGKETDVRLLLTCGLDGAEAARPDQWLREGGLFALVFFKWGPSWVRANGYRARAKAALKILQRTQKFIGIRRGPLFLASYGAFDFIMGVRAETFAAARQATLEGGRFAVDDQAVMKTFSIFGGSRSALESSGERVWPRLMISCHPAAEAEISAILAHRAVLGRYSPSVRQTEGASDLVIHFKRPVPVSEYFAGIAYLARAAGGALYATHSSVSEAALSGERTRLDSKKLESTQAETLDLGELPADLAKTNMDRLTFIRAYTILGRYSALLSEGAQGLEASLYDSIDRTRGRLGKWMSLNYPREDSFPSRDTLRSHLSLRLAVTDFAVAQRRTATLRAVQRARARSTTLYEGGTQKLNAFWDEIFHELTTEVGKKLKVKGIPAVASIIGYHPEVVSLFEFINIPEADSTDPVDAVGSAVHEWGHHIYHAYTDRAETPPEPMPVYFGELRKNKEVMEKGGYYRECRMVEEGFADWVTYQTCYGNDYSGYARNMLDQMRQHEKFRERLPHYLARLIAVDVGRDGPKMAEQCTLVLAKEKASGKSGESTEGGPSAEPLALSEKARKFLVELIECSVTTLKGAKVPEAESASGAYDRIVEPLASILYQLPQIVCFDLSWLHQWATKTDQDDSQDMEDLNSIAAGIPIDTRAPLFPLLLGLNKLLKNSGAVQQNRPITKVAAALHFSAWRRRLITAEELRVKRLPEKKKADTP